MQISVDVHNYMEVLVGQLLAGSSYVDKYNDEQLADLACLALSQLRPVYIRHDIDFLAALPLGKMDTLKQYANDAVLAAESMIINDQRKRRDTDIPVVITSQRSEDLELEWYEKPIVNKIN
ncbi:late competence development ComFB family protein [Vibrio sp. RC27]